MTVKWPVN